MDYQKKIIDFLKKEEYSEAEQIFIETPVFNYITKSPLFKYNYFEFSKTQGKNPVFLRILLNYISLINIINDEELPGFHDILLSFHAKFTYEKLNNENIKLILMVKSSTEVYDTFFKNGLNIFQDNNDIDLETIDFKEIDEKGVGYSFQELGKIFLNDYIIGKDIGIELPNILFYIKSIEETQNLIGKIFHIPMNLKLNLNEKCNKSGVNEFDHIIKLKDDLKINENNPYFRYIKIVNGSEVQYGELLLKKNEIYILEFKHAYQMNEDIAKIENLGKLYFEIYNKNVKPIENDGVRVEEFKILYFYNYLEKLGYKNLSQYNINKELWRFLYLNPSCQIVPVTRLSAKVAILEKKVKINEEKLETVSKELSQQKIINESINKELNQQKDISKQINMKWKEKFGEDIFSAVELKKSITLQQSKGQKLTIEKESKFQIEEIFKEKFQKIKKTKDFAIFNELFDRYKNEIKEFMDTEEKLEIDEKNEIWKNELKSEIADNDFKTCFQVLAPCIGKRKASNNYFKIQNYFINKINKKDEMSDIYNYIYKCLYGKRTKDDKKPREKFYEKSNDNFKILLKNIIKYTFYLDMKRKGKEYYILALFQELLINGNEEIFKLLIKLKGKSLYEVVFMTIILMNSDNLDLLNGYIDLPKNHNF
jgi:hypothetical protein